MTLLERYVRRATEMGFIVHPLGDDVPLTGTPSRAAYALAESGSIVLLASDEPRSRSLLPYIHYTYVPVERILPDIETLLAKLGDRPPSCVSIVSGPSSSGDIEMKITVGVHGPAEEHVILTSDDQ
jgi:L-lactate utilization protein LutC